MVFCLFVVWLLMLCRSVGAAYWLFHALCFASFVVALLSIYFILLYWRFVSNIDQIKKLGSH